MIDWNKPLQTRNGEAAKLVYVKQDPADRILRGAVIGSETHVVVVTHRNGNEEVREYFSDGAFTTSHASSFDLVNVPETSGWFFNLYQSSDGEMTLGPAHRTPEDVRQGQGITAKALIAHVGILKFTSVDNKLTRVELVWKPGDEL